MSSAGCSNVFVRSKSFEEKTRHNIIITLKLVGYLTIILRGHAGSISSKPEKNSYFTKNSTAVGYKIKKERKNVKRDK